MQKIKRYIKVLRLEEVLLMVGFLSIGCIFSISELNWENVQRLLLYSLGSIFYVISGYAFNAYGGYQRDQYNKRLNVLKHIGANSFLQLSLLFGCLFCLCYALLSWTILAVSILPFVLGMWYAWPEKGAKYYPIIGTVIHFVSQLFLFYMGYLLFKQIDIQAMYLSIYFAILLSAAHLNHEVIDYQADKMSGYRSSAVYFGVEKIEKISVFLYCLAAIYWMGLYRNERIEFIPFLAFFLAFIAQLITKAYLAQEKEKIAPIEHSTIHIKYRNLYRLYYLLAGIGITFYQVINSLK